ncbi:MAG: hypothetical protein ACRC6X_02115 [Culicoidibacterales bacterium]
MKKMLAKIKNLAEKVLSTVFQLVRLYIESATFVERFDLQLF